MIFNLKFRRTISTTYCASALIRQLIMDDPALAHLANRSKRIKFRFRVMADVPPPKNPPIFSWIDVTTMGHRGIPDRK